jgi:hypothetical protein
MREVKLARMGGDYICLAISTGKRSTRFFMTEDQAQHLANRLQSFAHGNIGHETVLQENEI